MQFEAEIADCFQHDRFIRLPGRHDGTSDREPCDIPVAQTLDEAIDRWRRQQLFLVLCRVKKQRAVLGNNQIENLDPAEGLLQVGQLSAGDEKDLAPGPLHLLQGGNASLVNASVVREGSVVIDRESNKQHGYFICIKWLMPPLTIVVVPNLGLGRKTALLASVSDVTPLEDNLPSSGMFHLETRLRCPTQTKDCRMHAVEPMPLAAVGHMSETNK